MTKPLTDSDLIEIEARREAATCELTEDYAVKHLGWQWWSWIGTPVKGTPGYPQKMRVRQLLSAKQLKEKRWSEFLADPRNEARLADGTEPLDYTYCSSGCSAEWPPTRKVTADSVARDDVPRLVAEVRRLRAILGKRGDE